MDATDVTTIMERVAARLAQSGREAVAWHGDARIESGAPLGRYFDHTLLKQEAGAPAYEALCDEALRVGARTVCVPPNRVALCIDRLTEGEVAVCTVVGFPFGYDSTSAKVADVEVCRALGAMEFDMVLAVGLARDDDLEGVYDDARAVVSAAGGRLVKVILETALLTDEQKVSAAAACLHAGVAMLKTSTGFASGGATPEDIRLLRLCAGATHGVKASGGIRTLETARAMIDAGADRIGASATVSILREATGGSAAPAGGSDY